MVDDLNGGALVPNDPTIQDALVLEPETPRRSLADTLGSLPAAGPEDLALPGPEPARPRLADVLSGIPSSEAETLSQMYRGLPGDPDTEGKVIQLSERTGIPDVTVRNKMAAVERLANEPDWAAVAKTAPTLTGLMVSDPVTFSLAHDDIDTLSTLEGLARTLKLSPAAAVAGFDRGIALALEQIGQRVVSPFSIVGRPLAEAGILPEDPFARVSAGMAEAAGAYRKNAGAWVSAEDQEGLGSTGRSWLSGMQSAGQAFPGLLASIVTRSATPMLSAIGLQTLESEMQEAEGKGLGPVTSTVFGGVQAGAEVLGELIPAMKLVAGLKAGAPLWQIMAGQVGHELWTEQITTAWQDFNRWMMLEPEKTAADFLAERPGAAYETLIATLAMTLTQTGGAIGVAKITDMYGSEQQSTVDADAFKNRIVELTDLATQSKLRERSPGKFEQMIDGMLAENSEADVFVNANEFSEFFQSQGVNPMEIAGQLTGVAAQLPEAMLHGGDVRIKASEYITRLGATEYQQGLNEIIRAQPEAMSAKEAAEWQDTQQERFQELVDQVNKQHEGDSAWEQSAQQVETFVQDQIVQSGRFDAQTAAKDAALHSSLAKVLASKMGLQPHQVYEKFGLRVAGAPIVQDGQQYDQQTGSLITDTPEFKAWFGESKVPGVVYHTTVADFDTFKTRPGDLGIHFGTQGQAEDRFKLKIDRDPFGPQLRGVQHSTMPVYLSIKNPLRLPDLGAWGAENLRMALPEEFTDAEKRGAKTVAQMRKLLRAHGYDGIVYANTGETGGAEPYRKATESARSALPRGKSSWTLEEQKDPTYLAYRAADQAYRDYRESNAEDSYIALDPRQIKSAIGNRGTFDPKDPNILHQSAVENLTSTAERGERITGSRAAISAEELQAIKASGYAGYWTDHPSLGLVAAIFEKLPVESHVDETPARYSQSPVGTPRFKAWFGKSKVVEGKKPKVVYHGTTHDFDAFSPERGNPENDLGVGYYFTDNKTDVASNYAGEGPDLTSRIETRAEELLYEIEYDTDGRTLDVSEEEHEANSARALYLAREELSGGAPNVMPVYLSLQNPVIIGGRGQTSFGGFEFDEETGDESGPGVDLYNAIMAVALDFQDVDGQKLWNDIADLQADGIGAQDFVKLVKSSDGSAYATDEDGRLASGEFLRQVFEYLGYDGVIDRSVSDKFGETSGRGVHMAGVTKGTTHYIAFEPEQVKSAIGNSGAFDPDDPSILNQQARGSIQFPIDLTKAPSVINLLEGADLSTFLHETGHFFFEVYRTIASQPDAPAEILADMRALLAFVEVPDLATWNAMTPEQRRDGHEKVARAFEAYLFEGKAPSPGLSDLFQTFSRWLVNVYKSIAALDVKLTPEVRQVFNRMLASDEEIRAVETMRQYAPIFESLDQAGMSIEDWAAYQALGQSATEDASVELQHRSLKDMRWLSGAKARELKRLQKDADGKRKDVRREAAEKVYSTPIYAARRYLTHGDREPITNNQKSRRLAEALALQPGKLSKTALLEIYGDGPAAPWRYLPTGKRGMMAQDGIHPNELAELFGFDSGDALVRQLLEAQDPELAIDALTDQMMLERYGDITAPAVLDHMADVAVHNQARLKFLNTELRALDQLVNVRGDTGRTDSRGRKISYNILEQAAREFVAQAVGRKKVREAGKISAYAAAETRAGKAAQKAMGKGDIQSAAEHKRAQVLNAHFVSALGKAGDEVDSILRYLKKFDSEGTRTNLDRGYLDQIDQLLEKIDLRKGITRGEIESRKKLAAWVAEQEEMGFAPAVPQDLIDAAQLQHYSELTIDEFRTMRDAIKSIEHLGRLKKKLLTAKDKREFDAIIDAAVASIEDHSEGPRPVEIENDLPSGRMAKGIAEFFASHRKLADILRAMDGFGDGGAMWELLMRPLNDAMDREAAMKEAATIALNGLVSKLKQGGKLYQKEFIPEIQTSLSKMGRLMVALNLGNETNRARLNQGYGWSPQQIDAITRTLTKEDWDFVQGVWDMINGYWPEIAAKQERISGVVPEKVQATPVVTPFGEYPGGYFQIKYDVEQSPKAHQDATAEAAKDAMRGARVRATTRRGHLEQRVDEVKRPLNLSFSVVFSHLEQVIHDLAMHEYLIDQARVLNDKRMQDAIVTHHGPQFYRQITNAMTAVAAGDVPATMAHEQAANYLRAGATIAGMAWKLTTGMLQPLGLTQSVQRIGAKWVGRGIARAFTDATSLQNTYAWISEKSTMMRLRSKTMQREINEIRNHIEKEGWFQDQLNRAAQAMGAEHAPDIKDSYFWLIVKLQMVADIPTWIGQYEKSMAAGETEERAIALADQAVLDAQGGGQIKDLAAIQRGHPWFKLWTNFYSYFNVTFNRTQEAFGRASIKSPTSLGRLGVDLLMLYTIPSVLASLMYEAIRNDCDGNPECIGKKIAKDQLSYMLGTVVGLREIQAMFSPYGYSGPAGARAISEISNLGKQAAQGELDEALLRSANKAGGILFHYPAGQIDATVRGLAALASGETDRVTAVGFGPPVNE